MQCPILTALVACGAARDAAEARALIRRRVVYLDGDRIDHPDRLVEIEDGAVLQVGEETFRYRTPWKRGRRRKT